LATALTQLLLSGTLAATDTTPKATRALDKPDFFTLGADSLGRAVPRTVANWVCRL